MAITIRNTVELLFVCRIQLGRARYRFVRGMRSATCMVLVLREVNVGPLCRLRILLSRIKWRRGIGSLT